MINTQRTGAYISRLRKDRDITQAELAETLLVSPQAVSKWETGQGLPDPEQLLALSQFFGVTVNEILLGEATVTVTNLVESVHSPTPESEDVENLGLGSPPPPPVPTPPTPPSPPPHRLPATGPDVHLTHSGGVHLVPPSARPSDAADWGTIVGLAPFLERDALSEILERRGGDSLTCEQLADIAPFVDRDALARCAERIDRFDLDCLEDLAPFLHADGLERLIARVEGPISPDRIADLAPFLKRGALEMLLDRMAGPITVDQAEDLAPFISSHRLGELLQTSVGDKSEKSLTALAPFLSREQLRSAVLASPPSSLAALEELAPFLDRATVSELARRLMSGD